MGSEQSVHKEAYLYEKLEDNKVRCNLCSHRCLIHSGNRGVCGVRENRKGTLYSLVYGKAIAEHIDPVEKKPLYHFLPGTKAYSIATIGCNFRCDFCQNWRISQYRGTDLPGRQLSPREIVFKAKGKNCASIAYTYTEPTIFFEYAYDTARLAKNSDIKNVFVTNGYQTEETVEKMAGVIDAANIDLKSFSNQYYRNVCGATLQPVLESIKKMYSLGIWLEITTLVVPGQNDSTEELRQIAQFIAEIDCNIPWHISRFHPSNKMTNIEPTPVSKLKETAKLGEEEGLKYIYLGNLRTKKWQNTYCPNCGKLVIERNGYQVKKLLDNNRCPSCGTIIAGIY